mmetsp:Transcript_9504/g.23541  ORF Transcript_9504/g.23541 Transcript_9504/m.23541 type:complete len:270 (+) Transcript_9504:84-893(+)
MLHAPPSHAASLAAAADACVSAAAAAPAACCCGSKLANRLPRQYCLSYSSSCSATSACTPRAAENSSDHTAASSVCAHMRALASTGTGMPGIRGSTPYVRTYGSARAVDRLVMRGSTTRRMTRAKRRLATPPLRAAVTSSASTLSPASTRHQGRGCAASASASRISCSCCGPKPAMTSMTSSMRPQRTYSEAKPVKILTITTPTVQSACSMTLNTGVVKGEGRRTGRNTRSSSRPSCRATTPVMATSSTAHCAPRSAACPAYFATARSE